MLLAKRILAIALSVASGLVFIYSAYAKLYPVIEPFEFSFVELKVANWYTAPVFARLLIALEVFAGVLLIANYRLRKFTLWFTGGILVFFTLYLSAQILLHGNAGNCGCFGEHLKMTPLQAILKNVVMLLVLVVIGKLYEGWTIGKHWLLPALIAPLCVALPFFLNPIDYNYTSNNLDEVVNYPLALDLLYAPEDTSKVERPLLDLREGKQVLAFLSLSCPHCRIAAKKFKLIKELSPDLPIYFVFNGDRKDLPEFIEDTKISSIPFSFCLGKSFVQLSSAHLPRIYYLNNGIVVKKVDYFELNQYHIENWIKTGVPE